MGISPPRPLPCSTCPCTFFLLSPCLSLHEARADVLCERLEMEVLRLWLFPWIFQCVSVRADSIIHIGKRGSGGGLERDAVDK